MCHNKEEKICHCFHFIVILTKIAVHTEPAIVKTMLFLSISNYSKFLQNIGFYFSNGLENTIVFTGQAFHIFFFLFARLLL